MGRQSLKNVVRLIESANANIPVEQDFLNDLKRSIELSADKDTRKPSQSYKPSSMNCIRNMYFQLTGQDQDDSSSSYILVGIVNSGSDIHERVQGYIVDMQSNGIDCEYINVADFIKSRGLDDIDIVGQQGMETKLYHKKLNMSFLTDGIIRYKNKYYILELKTETSFKWQSRKGVDHKHYNQATAYSIAFGLDDVIFVYINRDILDMKAYMLTVTSDMKNDLIGKIDLCDSYVSRKEIPPKPEEASNKFCQYCAYRSVCE